MWTIKEQSQTNQLGKVCSPIMETQSGAETLRDMMQKEHDKNRKPDEEPKHYYVALAIKRKSKKQ